MKWWFAQSMELWAPITIDDMVKKIEYSNIAVSFTAGEG